MSSTTTARSYLSCVDEKSLVEIFNRITQIRGNYNFDSNELIAPILTIGRLEDVIKNIFTAKYSYEAIMESLRNAELKQNKEYIELFKKYHPDYVYMDDKERIKTYKLITELDLLYLINE